jgi:periplasmic protein TonB
MGHSSPEGNVCLCAPESQDIDTVEGAEAEAIPIRFSALEEALQDAIYRDRILVELQEPPKKVALSLSCALVAILLLAGRIGLRRAVPKEQPQATRISLAMEIPAEGMMPPPPPPPPPAGSLAQSTITTRSPEIPVQPEPSETELPTTLPEPSIPPSVPGVPGGAPGGIAGGTPGGILGGKPGGVMGASSESEPVIPPRANAAYLKNPQPIYPAASRRAREAGTVKLRVLVGADGRVLELEIKQSSGFKRLDDAALEAVRKWSFIPAKRGEASVDAWVMVPITFSLN